MFGLEIFKNNVEDSVFNMMHWRGIFPRFHEIVKTNGKSQAVKKSNTASEELLPQYALSTNRSD